MITTFGLELKVSCQGIIEGTQTLMLPLQEGTQTAREFDDQQETRMDNDDLPHLHSATPSYKSVDDDDDDDNKSVASVLTDLDRTASIYDTVVCRSSIESTKNNRASAPRTSQDKMEDTALFHARKIRTDTGTMCLSPYLCDPRILVGEHLHIKLNLQEHQVAAPTNQKTLLKQASANSGSRPFSMGARSSLAGAIPGVGSRDANRPLGEPRRCSVGSPAAKSTNKGRQSLSDALSPESLKRMFSRSNDVSVPNAPVEEKVSGEFEFDAASLLAPRSAEGTSTDPSSSRSSVIVSTAYRGRALSSPKSNAPLPPAPHSRSKSVLNAGTSGNASPAAVSLVEQVRARASTSEGIREGRGSGGDLDLDDIKEEDETDHGDDEDANGNDDNSRVTISFSDDAQSNDNVSVTSEPQSPDTNAERASVVSSKALKLLGVNDEGNDLPAAITALHRQTSGHRSNFSGGDAAPEKEKEKDPSPKLKVLPSFRHHLPSFLSSFPPSLITFHPFLPFHSFPPSFLRSPSFLPSFTFLPSFLTYLLTSLCKGPVGSGPSDPSPSCGVGVAGDHVQTTGTRPPRKIHGITIFLLTELFCAKISLPTESCILKYSY
jgi:hypothetical protein